MKFIKILFCLGCLFLAMYTCSNENNGEEVSVVYCTTSDYKIAEANFRTCAEIQYPQKFTRASAAEDPTGEAICRYFLGLAPDNTATRVDTRSEPCAQDDPAFPSYTHQCDAEQTNTTIINLYKDQYGENLRGIWYGVTAGQALKEQHCDAFTGNVRVATGTWETKP